MRVQSEPTADIPPVKGCKGRVFLVIRLLGGRSGGAERLFCETASMLAEAGYDVTCLHCDSTRKPPFYPLSPKVTLINLWGKTARRGRFYRALDWLSKPYPKREAFAPLDWLSRNLFFTRRLYVAAKHAKPDVIISFLPPANTPSLLAGRLAGAKVVPTNHNVPEQDYRSPLRWDQNPVDRWLRLRALNGAERIHVLFPTFAEWFPDALRDRIVVVENYVSRDFTHLDRDTPRENVVAAVGRLAPVKNYLDLIEAWSYVAEDHPDWQVRIYGVGPQKRELGKRIGELGLRGRVRLMGHTTEVTDALLSARLFCHPAIHEGFGLSVAEALACGLPVVGYADCDGVNEFVHDEDNGLMVSREGGPKALADGLRRLIEDDELRERLAARAPDSVARFNEDRFLATWIDIIEDIRRREGAAS
ncbi:MAG TPA: glycosyltransferase [Sandaracinaceae bacterium LLY-WYZ-13_1]|nr:glycosyltransferase [Sandaracinaceae bacterium LLY-WYZ-13_1]